MDKVEMITELKEIKIRLNNIADIMYGEKEYTDEQIESLENAIRHLRHTI